MEQIKRKSSPGGLKRGQHEKNMKIIAAVFLRWSKKRKSNNDDNHGHDQGENETLNIMLREQEQMLMKQQPPKF